MVDKLADDVIQRLSQLQVSRSHFEAIWTQVSNVAAPEASTFRRMNALGMLKGVPRTALAAERSKYIFDSTGVNAVDRLASGIEDIVTPQSQYWHGLGVKLLGKKKLNDNENAWLEDQRNLLFSERYDADTGFVTAMQTVYRRTVAFGNAFLFVCEPDDYRNDALIHYRYIPLAECYVAEDKLGIVHTWYRHYVMTAEQAYMTFREQTPPKIAQAAQHPTDKDKEFAFIHCIQPRADFGPPSQGVRKSKHASFHISEEDRSIIRESGFYEFPVIDFRWLPEPGSIYGEGPVMKCLADIQSLQQMAKNELMAGEQSVRPPLLMANAGIMNRPDSRPGGMTYGGLNAQGQRLVEPLFNGQRLDFATMVLEAKRAQVKDSMFLNLFQILVQNPQMTATEALQRAGEKGALLGPAGSRFQQSLSRMVERELGILSRKGLYDQDSIYRTPRSLAGMKVQSEMTSPLDRLRRAKEGEGILRILEIASPLAQADPEVMDNIDGDHTLRELRDILGAPVKVLRDPEQVAQRREARRVQQSALVNAQVAEQMASASKQGSEALAGMKSAGAL